MVTDHAGGIEAVTAIGKELLDQVEPSERPQVQETVGELEERWSALQDTVHARHAALEAALTVAKDFHEKEGPFVEWLDKTEKKVRINSFFSSGCCFTKILGALFSEQSIPV